MPRAEFVSYRASLISPRSIHLSYYANGGYYFAPYENAYPIAQSLYAGNYVMPSDTLPEGAVWIGQFLATDEAKEIAVPEGYYNQIVFELVSGYAGLSTVWLRPEKTEVSVSSRLNAGEVLTIDFGDAPRYIDALRLSDTGNGIYRIYGL
ncbi:MAG: hypothetical protein FWG37_01610 [Clostridia bacterium]|nr:hypothetical protein [Clostridia bacterium]